MAFSSGQKYLAEFVGTFALLLVGGGSAVFTLPLLETFFPGSPPIDVLGRILVVSFCFGFVLMALAYAFGDISGGHFNPAVTISMLVNGRMPARDVVPYLVAQIVGGIVGIGIIFAIVSGGPASFSTAAQGAALGSQCYSGSGAPGGCGFSLGAVFLLELAITFAFVLVIQLVTRPDSSAKNLAPVAIGTALLVTNLLAIPIDGASLNPVRSFSPALLSLYWSSDHWAIAESWLFWVAPILGGVLAAVVERALRD
ncbi:MAG TPA: aquaporin [Thermoplasmata archaeon]|nr:aquaporin [Thermoplasmata archaeon]